MSPNHRPHLPHVGSVGIELEMPQKLVNVVEAHVVVVELAIVLRAATDVTVAIHRCPPSVCAAGKVVGRVHEMG